MAKVSGAIPNFANGVSQQAMALRLASQGELQINAYSTVVDGLKKRPPTQRTANLGADLGANLHAHMINRDATERYEVLMSSTGIRVFDLSGNEKTVTAPNGYAYLSYSGSGRPPYRSITVGDYTFITNMTKKVAMGSAVEPEMKSEAIINVMAGNYGRDYKIIINGYVVAWYRTPDGTSANQSPAIDTAFIARRLATGEAVQMLETVNDKPNGDWVWKTTDTNLAANGINAANGWTVKVSRGTIYVKKNDGSGFSIGIEDGYNGHAMKAIKERVQDFADLPAYCEEGVVVRVSGSVTTKFDDYYVKFGKQSPTDDASTPGVWREVPAPGIKTAFDPATMPHVLIRNADGTFTFKRATWASRGAGDLETVPEPSFVGLTINELTFFKNRLGFLSGENVVLSRSGEFFDFWRGTATTLLDDDPIDVAATENGVSVLRSAEAFNDRLVLFADQKQFTFMGNELLTPKTASIRATTSYSMSSLTRPVATGSSIFFPVDRGQFSMIREYRLDENGIADAEDVTGHVPQYIPGSIVRMAASTHEDILVVLSDDDPAAIYVYKYYWANGQKLQSSWSKWTFPGVTKVIDIGFVSSQLFLIFDRSGEAFLECMDIQPGGIDVNQTFVTHLDRRFKVTNSSGAQYDPYTNQTIVPMTRDVAEDNYICVTAGNSGAKVEPGMVIDILESGANFVTLRGDLRGVPLYFGLPYEMRYSLSTIFVRQQSQGGGMQVITEGRLQLLQVLFQFSKTAFFRVEVTPLAQPTRAYFTNGRMMGDPENRVDRVHLSDGSFRIPILARNDRVQIDIVNDSYLPCSILSGEWIANYVRKSTRI
ncbi:hypothetical protein CN202_01775 [Sinorhizobium meliloti]|uniref:phage nozzle protein n=1 Tax=Rhizobium meliloti TaxID=382 RepID=UPI000FDCA5D4|nr:hypothetical protein [Sinorhizobium meliloti]RVI36664.1 hypothetical protein CN202_01775 [Sinorhizobium meliloti]